MSDGGIDWAYVGHRVSAMAEDVLGQIKTEITSNQPTLRDRFAMAAPLKADMTDATSPASVATMANLAYEWADAMLKARGSG